MRKFTEVGRAGATVTLVAVAAVFAACGKDDGTSPAPPPPPPASIQPVSSADSSQFATVGTLVPLAPSVVVRSSNGAPVRGATVVFAVVNGGGTITGASQSTDVNGVAAVGSWRLGTTAGSNTLTATVGTLPPVTFLAAGRPGPAATLTKIPESDNGKAFVGRYVYPPPLVRVLDQYGNAVTGSSVTFSVLSGGGSVTGPFVPTNNSGVTGVMTWKVGDTPGPNTLQASVPGVTPVVFTATALARCTATAIALGSSVAGTLTTADCSEGLFYYDHYGISLTAATTAVSITMTSPEVDSYLVLYDGQHRDFAGNDDASEMSLDSRVKALLPAGSYVAVASTYEVRETGRYNFAAQGTSASIDDCEEVFALPGIVAAQSIDETDCVDYYYGSNFDWVLLVLRAGETITFSMEGAAWPTYMALYSSQGLVDAKADGSLTITPARDALYGLYMSPNEMGRRGAYTLRLDRTAAPAGRVAESRQPVLQRSEKGLGSVRAVREAMRAGGPRSAPKR